MSSKINNLNPISVYGYHQHGKLKCNSAMSAAYCRTRTQDAIQAKYNKLHYPTEDASAEGFNNMTVENTVQTIGDYFYSFLEMLNPFNKTKVIEGNTTMKNSGSSECQALIKGKNNQHQIPSFKKSSVSPIDATANNKTINELYLKQCFDSQYDGDVEVPEDDENTLIQK